MPETVLVTGGAGYIGSHTTLSLLEAGYEVVVVDDLRNSSPRALDAVEQLAGRKPVFVEGDITESELLDAVFRAHDVSAVVHFAALKAVGESVSKPLSYYRNNVLGTVTLLEVMRAHDVHRAVFSSSCTVYGDPDRVPVTEDAPLRTTSPYGRTKLVSEQVFADVAATDPRWRVALLRYFNPVGAHPSGELGEDPRGIPNNLMPFLMQVAVGRLERLNVFGGDYDTRDGTCIRDYIHVVDLAEGHVAALASLDRLGSGCHAVNLGTGVGTTVLEMINAAGDAIGRPVPHEIVGRRPGDTVEVYADPSFATRMLGWRASRTVFDMCRDHWNWQSRHPDGFAGD